MATTQQQTQTQVAPSFPPLATLTGNIASILASLRTLPSQMYARTSQQRRVLGATYPSSKALAPVSELQRWSLVRGMQQELLSLKSGLANLRSSIDHGNSDEAPSSPDEQTALKQASVSISYLEDHLKTFLQGIPVTSRPTEASAVAARKLFDIPELLEKILLDCDFRDLLALRQVDKTFANGVTGSAHLQQIMGLRAATEGSPFSPLTNSFFTSRGCIVRLEDSHRFGFHVSEDEVFVSACIHGIDPLEPKTLEIGDFYRRMLVCQPPIQEMRVRTDCCNDPLFRRRHLPGAINQPLFAPLMDREEENSLLPLLRRETGITLGDIIDETKKMREEHRYCPDAHQGLHRDDGTVNMVVHFEAILKLNSNDPILAQRRATRAKFERDQKQLNARDNRMSLYVAAKQSARNQGQPIPTLEEFEAMSRATSASIELDSGDDDDDD